MIAVIMRDRSSGSLKTVRSSVRGTDWSERKIAERFFAKSPCSVLSRSVSPTPLPGGGGAPPAATAGGRRRYGSSQLSPMAFRPCHDFGGALPLLVPGRLGHGVAPSLAARLSAAAHLSQRLRRPSSRASASLRRGPNGEAPSGIRAPPPPSSTKSFALLANCSLHFFMT